MVMYELELILTNGMLYKCQLDVNSWKVKGDEVMFVLVT